MSDEFYNWVEKLADYLLRLNLRAFLVKLSSIKLMSDVV